MVKLKFLYVREVGRCDIVLMYNIVLNCLYQHCNVTYGISSAV